MSETRTHHVTLSLRDGYQFDATFPDVEGGPSMLLDEPAPLGDGRGPNATALLGAAVGNCLAASLLFCLKKSRAEVEGLEATVDVRVERNPEGRFRVTGITVTLDPTAVDDAAKLTRCEGLFEDFCVVTESVRAGIPVEVSVGTPNSGSQVTKVD